jgi:uncharacterized Zn finger protein
MAITLVCPSCGEECDHDLVGESRNPVVRCTLCGHTPRRRRRRRRRSWSGLS